MIRRIGAINANTRGSKITIGPQTSLAINTGSRQRRVISTVTAPQVTRAPKSSRSPRVTSVSRAGNDKNRRIGRDDERNEDH
ncbi:MAG TPA: hypothetical protein VLW50_29360 [Streptosporangiaceae bacterium]|nr:hypothetical protein [Streptosporangiaceae bacterium]